MKVTLPEVDKHKTGCIFKMILHLTVLLYEHQLPFCFYLLVLKQVILVLFNQRGQTAASGALWFRQDDLDASTLGRRVSAQTRPPGSHSAPCAPVHLRSAEVTEVRCAV